MTKKKRSGKDETIGGQTTLVDEAASSVSVEEAETTLQPHRMEVLVQHHLLSEPQFRFSSLVIKRLANGICLEGTVEIDDDAPDICAIVRQVAGVENVINHLLVRQHRVPPPKG